MLVNLRQANALARALQDEALKQTLTTSINVSVYADSVPFESLVKEAGETLRANLADALALTEAAYTVRGLMGQAFQPAGISALLTEKALLDRKEKIIAGVLGQKAGAGGFTAELAPARLRALKDALANSTTRLPSTEQVQVKLDDAAYDGLEDDLRAIRKRKAKISDELLSANAAHRIELPEDIVALVARFKLD